MKIIPGSLLIIVALCMGNMSGAQCKTFRLSDKGDTLNCVDNKGLKQGKWQIKVAELRGNPGYEEEGEFINDKREGVWRRFNLQGDPEAVQTYRWGLLNGKSQYYSLQGLEREESWWAIDPGQAYDTLDVPDLYQPDVTRKVVVKNEGHSMKHGKWTWYKSGSGFVDHTEEYFRDSAVNSLAIFGVSNKGGQKRLPKDTSAKAKEKPSIVQEWEKKNAGKKRVKYQDGSTGN